VRAATEVQPAGTLTTLDPSFATKATKRSPTATEAGTATERLVPLPVELSVQLTSSTGFPKAENVEGQAASASGMANKEKKLKQSRTAAILRSLRGERIVLIVCNMLFRLFLTLVACSI
jgi:hypothetical protein